MALHETDDAVDTAQLAVLLWEGVPRTDGTIAEALGGLTGELVAADGRGLPLGECGRGPGAVKR